MQWAIQGFLLDLLGVQAKLDRRAAARGTYVRLRGVARKPADDAARLYPWLEQQQGGR